MSEQHEQYDDDTSEPQAHAASESGPTTYSQSDWVDPTSTGLVEQMPDTVVYGEAGVHHDSEWTEPGSDEDETVSKVVRAEEGQQPTHATAVAKGGRPERFSRR